MRYERDIFIAGVGSSVPATRRVRDAVAEGRIDERTARQMRMDSVAVSASEPGPVLAATAGRRAMAHAGLGPADIDLLLHATVHYQGHDLWPPASYIQREVPCGDGPALEVRQMSNGGMAALDLAAGYLLGGDSRSAALLTAGDRFGEPAFDRWRSDPGTLYGDAGAALVLSRRAGFARLLSLATVADSELEGMHRGDDPFGAAPFALHPVVDMERHKRAYVGAAGMSFTVARVSAGQRTALKRALAEADVTLDRIDRFVLPNLGWRRLDAAFFQPFGIPEERTVFDWGRTVGHLGAADQFAALAHLAATGALRPGEHVLLAGIGAGFTWSCAVVRVLDTPAVPPTTPVAPPESPAVPCGPAAPPVSTHVEGQEK
ncbi:ketoacyl-ACP synthase III family protein [Streptomyces gardneri]|uniref:ketoacyl-ACP synthase III family protein n=1 Tax=Streptomyces gardneri TaxID=66892 RepID=UPI00368E5D06